MKHHWFFLALATVLAVASGTAQPPQTLSYQGVLTSSGGIPVPDGVHNLTFALYVSDTGGSPIWSENHTSVPTTNGTFSAILGSVSTLAGIDFSQQLYLGVTRGVDPEFSPRSRLTSAPAALAPWAISGTNLTYSGGKVGVGTTSPYHLFQIGGGFDGHLGFGPSDGTPNAGYIRFGDNTGWKLHLGRAREGSGGAINTGTTGAFMTLVDQGLVGIGTTAPVARLDVQWWSGSGINVYNGFGTYGVATTGGTAGISAFGYWNGIEAGSSNNIGVFGSGPQYGVWAQGRLGASGTKSFSIDHPADPTGMYLMHYSAESPDVLNMYTGNIVTGADGTAVVTLPDYFDEINRDPRYSLTVIEEGGTDFVHAMVVQEIRENRFVIRTSKPRVKVSWRVDAIRNDLWIRIYGAPVEKEKKEAERGKYQHPELYGMPKEMAISYRPGPPGAVPDPRLNMRRED